MAFLISLISLFLITLVLSGCASSPKSPSTSTVQESAPPVQEPYTSYQIHPEWSTRKKSIKTINVLPVKVDVFQISAGGTRERVDQWSDDAGGHLSAALVTKLSSQQGLTVEPTTKDSFDNKQTKNLAETEALLDVVVGAINRHASAASPERFDHKLTKFEYSLGPEVSDLAHGADALLILWGVDHVSTAGRKAAQIGMAVLALAAGVVAVPQGGVGALALALVDARDGHILAFSLKRCQACGGLHTQEGAVMMLESSLSDFPLAQ